MNIKKAIATTGFVAAGITAGAVLIFSGAANAATLDNAHASKTGSISRSAFGKLHTATTSSSSSSTSTDAPTGTPPQRSDETIVTGTKADTLTAAAEAKVPGATVIRVETDADGAAYEVHMKKSDGSLTTVLFNSDLTVKSVEAGMGAGPKGGHAGGPGGGDHDGDGPGAPAGASSSSSSSSSSSTTTN